MVNTSTSTSTSASLSQPKPSAAGWASLTGLAILANPRLITASKTIVLDAQVFLGPTDSDLLIGSLCYFNSTDYTFNDEPHLYSINATFARRESMADVPVSGNRALLDYTFIGDILTLIPLGRPGPHYDLDPEELPNDRPSEGNEGYVHIDDFRTFTIDPCVRPYIHITGIAMECSKAEATFELTVEQYISCAKSDRSKQADGSRLKPTTHFFCHIPDSPKYKSWACKPIPGNKRWVSVCGFLTGVESSRDKSEVEQFRIDIENVTFCGQYISPANLATSVSQNSPGPGTSAIFSYRAPPQSSPKSHKQRNQDGA